MKKVIKKQKKVTKVKKKQIHPEINNTVLVCKSCTEDYQQYTQAELKRQEIKICAGDFVKTRFKHGKLTENMWIKVKDVLGDLVAGTLENTPILVRNINYGDAAMCNHKDIQAYISKDSDVMINPIVKEVNNANTKD